MKILHTADWHLGRHFYGKSLEEDHAAILSQVLAALETHRPDVLIIAGDIYDRASPPATAVRQFNGFIQAVATNTETAIVMIAGNHDSGDRLASMATLADGNRALIRGPMMAQEYPLVISDKHGPVAFSALPFGHEFSARECYGDSAISTPADVIAAQVQSARNHVPTGARWVIIAHAFVTNATPSESERSLQVGGIETVPASAFDGAHYVALGHLHRPQNAGGEHIRYSGSPLAFSFDEAGSKKSMTLVHLSGDGSVSSEFLPFEPIKAVRILKGTLVDLLAVASGSPSNDFFKLILTDKGRLIDPMGQIRAYYPNTMALTYERDENAKPLLSDGSTDASLQNPLVVIGEFLNHVRGEDLDMNENQIVAAALEELTRMEACS